MITFFKRSFGFPCTSTLALLAFASVSCSANIHDNTINIPNATVNATTDVDVSNVVPGQQVPVVVTVQNVYLVDPNTAPPPEHVSDAGHVQVYLDDTTTTPLLITAQAMFDVTVPADTKPGNHKLICRVHKHDGTPTTTQKEINIVVKVSADGGVTVDVDANTVPADAGKASTGGATGAGGTTGAGGGSGAGGTAF